MKRYLWHVKGFWKLFWALWGKDYLMESGKTARPCFRQSLKAAFIVWFTVFLSVLLAICLLLGGCVKRDWCIDRRVAGEWGCEDPCFWKDGACWCPRVIIN